MIRKTKKSFFENPKILLIFFIFLIGFLFFLFSKTTFFNIKSVEVQTENVSCTDPENIKSLVSLKGSNFLFLDSAKIVNKIKNKFYCISLVKVSKDFPDKVIISAFGRQAKIEFYNLRLEEATVSADILDIATPSASVLEMAEKFGVDGEGVIFIKDVNLADKIYYFNGDLILGQKLKYPSSESIKIFEKIKNYNIHIREAKILDYSFLINSIEKNTIVFNLSKDIDKQLASLQLILNQAKIEEKVLEFIDLRFDKPVIRTVKLAPHKN